MGSLDIPRSSRVNLLMSGEGENFKVLVRGGCAEAIGVFLFVFTGCGAAISAGGGLYPIAFAFGLAIMVLVFATADISGGHLNPAVSIAFLVTQVDPKFTVVKCIVWILCQCAGAIFGALFLKALTPDAFHATHLGCNDIGGISAAQAIFIEVITTFTLVITVFSNAVTAASPANGNIAPIPIGFAVILGILATGNVSGGSMNPARSIGPAVAAGYWHVHYVYWIGPIVGACCAGLLWKYVFMESHPGYTKIDN